MRICLILSTTYSCAIASDVTLTPSLPTPQPVGSRVTWTADSDSSDGGSAEYQFSVAPPGAAYNIVRDFENSNSFVWAPWQMAGDYRVRVVARDALSHQEVIAEADYSIFSRSIHASSVTPTGNPLVLLCSSAPCSIRSVVRVRFWSKAAITPQWTAAKACNGQAGVNFYIAGLRPDTTYSLQQLVQSDRTASFGSPLTYKTGPVQITLPNFTLKSSGAATVGNEEIIWGFLKSTGATGIRLLATDLSGALAWFYDEALPVLLCRITAGGNLLLLAAESADGNLTLLREIDVAGNTLRETSAARVSEQLVARGDQPIYYFSHDAIRLPGDFTAVLGTIARQEQDGLQGPGLKLVEGDSIIVLDENFQVVWSWNAFDHLDVGRGATGGDAGVLYPNGPVANDWTHSNSLDYLPSDGNLLLSLRSQDWVVKLDYRDGKGTGDVLWRMGKD